jgi:hypothetical protein
MRFTVVYISDDLSASCYGTFSTREAAQKACDKMRADLDAVATVIGDMGHAEVCQIQRKGAWR